MRIAPPSLPPHHSDPAARDFQSSIPVEALLRGCHLEERHSTGQETTVLDCSRGQELLLKEALHIQMTPSEERFNRDGGLEVPGCWIAVMRRQGGRSNLHRPLTPDDVYPQ